ncbi:PH domain-containing protein [Candidatus Parcubacteria bacterium]|nr:PH domain-containing protein [Candidatus Parcubacteria bacterium]
MSRQRGQYTDEKIYYVISGQYEIKILGKDSIRKGIFLTTNKSLIFYAKKLIGYDFEVFPYSNISSIEMSKGIMGYSISFFASGNKAKMKWIKEIRKGDVKKFIECVKENIGKKIVKDNLQKPVLDVTEQIKRLAELKEQGILTDEEFNSKKKELLLKLK